MVVGCGTLEIYLKSHFINSLYSFELLYFYPSSQLGIHCGHCISRGIHLSGWSVTGYPYNGADASQNLDY